MATQSGSEDPRGVSGQLNSWKEIAAYLGREPRTIQRWEKEEGLPVHRHLHSKRSSVYAYPNELDSWWRNRPALQASPAGSETSGGEPDSNPHTRATRIWLIAAIVVSLSGVIWLYSSRPEITPSPLAGIPLTAYPGYEFSPTFSPDGEQVAFAWNAQSRKNFDIYVKQIGSYSPQQLTHDPRNEYNPAWSPDGRSIAFLRDIGGGRADVILIPSRGGHETRLTETSAPQRPNCGPDVPLGSLAWSPDGRWLAISDKSEHAEPFAITALSVESGQRRKLTSPIAPSVGDYAATFSPDGSALAFCRFTVYGVSDIYMMRLSADLHALDQGRKLTSEGQWSISPSWTPAGDALVYSIESGLGGLFRIHTSGISAPQRLALIGSSGTMPVLSRRGNRLAYVRKTIDCDIYALPLNQADMKASHPIRRVSSTSSEANMDYSPDGNRIAFNSARSGTSEIWISNKDGANPFQLTSFGAKQVGTPRWSPDGKQIVFDSRSDGAGEIWMMNVEGKSPPRQLTHDPSSDLVPSWSRNGQWVYFSSNRTGQYQVWRLPLGGGRAVQITRHGGGHGIESRDGRSLFYSKTLLDTGPGGTSIWTVPVTGGEETKVLDSVSSWSHFTVTHTGIYFIRDSTQSGATPSILFYAFADHNTRVVARMEKPLCLGLSLASDGRSLLYSQIEHEDGDLMLVEGFR